MPMRNQTWLPLEQMHLGRKKNRIDNLDFVAEAFETLGGLGGQSNALSRLHPLTDGLHA